MITEEKFSCHEKYIEIHKYSHHYSETLEFNAYQIEIESNRIEPNRIESNRIETNRIESNRIESKRTESNQNEINRIETNRIESNRKPEKISLCLKY